MVPTRTYLDTRGLSREMRRICRNAARIAQENTSRPGWFRPFVAALHRHGGYAKSIILPPASTKVLAGINQGGVPAPVS